MTTKRSRLSIISKGLYVGLLAAATVISPLLPAAQVHAQTQRSNQFDSAAQEFGVPKELLMAISYNESRWENHDGEPSATGGYGLMHLTSAFNHDDSRGDPSRPLPPTTIPTKRTLDEAAQLLGLNAETIKKDDKQNIRAGAALLAKYARQTNAGQLPKDLPAWKAATAKLSASDNPADNDAFANNVLSTIEQGASANTTDGQRLSIAPKPTGIVNAKMTPQAPKLNNRAETPVTNQNPATECPITIKCQFVPARHAQNNPNDATDYGNYDPANRPDDLKIKYIVIHDTEGSYQSAIDWFKNPQSYTSAHYVIRSKDGDVTQMVRTKDTAWQAGNWYMNMHSIGIEHEGFAHEGSKWYTEDMYRSSAELVRYLAQKYNIPLDREHIIGHEQLHALTADKSAGMHYDPGPYWDWGHYMELLHAPVHPSAGPFSNVVTIAPPFQHNHHAITYKKCEDTCNYVTDFLPTNFVYLRSQPDPQAPLLSDAALHPNGAPGSTMVGDTSARAMFGQRYAVAERRGEWIAIWFNGQKGWFRNNAFRVAYASAGQRLTPKVGKTSVPVYGGAYPESSAFPSHIPSPANQTPPKFGPLQFNIPAGQQYVRIDATAMTDYYYSWTFDHSLPGDGTVVVGHEAYYPVNYGHRQGFVKASDVDLVR